VLKTERAKTETHDKITEQDPTFNYLGNLKQKEKKTLI
jgi:hypothetical protein